MMRMFHHVHRTLVVASLLIALATFAQDDSSASPSHEQMQSLADAQRWNELVRLIEPVQKRSADANFYFGMALAQAGRTADAEKAFEDGWRESPREARFPTELAGLAFRQKQNARAERLLQRAVHLAPHDSYVNDFLGTLYFLDGNSEAALKYWNRVNKPQVAEVRTDPQPRISPALLDHAFAFAPSSTLEASQYLDSKMRLDGLGVFPQYQIDLSARPDGRFDAVVRARERDGFGDGIWEKAFLFLRGIPFQQVSPSYFNFRREAINFDSFVRWDAQKRRMNALLSGPLERDAKLRWELHADLRNENWAVRNGFAGTAPVLASFNLRTERGSAGVTSYTRGRYQWQVGAEISHRDLRNVAAGAVLTAPMLATGYALKQHTGVSGTLWRVPERRFVVNASATSETARLWSSSPESFEKLDGAVGWRWFPQTRGDDYAVSQQVRAGRIFGQSPFDELYILGLERDNNLPMRAHIGTRDGRKGSAPLGREYFLENGEFDKNLYSNGLFEFTLGPFVDVGKMGDGDGVPGSHEWLVDAGGELKFRVLGNGLIFSYGKDLRTGNNAFYLKLME